MTQFMNSIVVHYKELALKGRNRPWFVQMLNRNLRTALAGLGVASIRSVMGRIEIELGPRTSWVEVRDRLGRVFGIANFSYAGRGPQDFAAAGREHSRRARRAAGRLVSRQRAPLRQAVSVYVATD